MDPPFVSALLSPSLSNFSASFKSYTKPSARSSSRREAKAILKEVAPPQHSENKSRLFIRDEYALSTSCCIPGFETNALLSAQSVEALPHRCSQEIPSQNEELEPVPLLPINPVDSSPLSSQKDSPSSPQLSSVIESRPISRRKLSLSSPHDTLNSAPNMHRRPVTGYHRAGIFCGPACREFSAFGNPAVAAAEEMWRRGDESNLDRSTIERQISKDDPPMRRKATLAIPERTEKNSSPKLHFRGRSTSGTFTEWICREQSGFANPTYAASTQRWQKSDFTNPDTLEAVRDTTVLHTQTSAPSSQQDIVNASPLQMWREVDEREVDEREGKGRKNGLPTASSWDMNKTHVLNSLNCCDQIGNGFGTGGIEHAKHVAGEVDANRPPLISFGPVSNKRTERADEYDQWSSRGGKAAPSMAAANQAVEASFTLRFLGVITPYPVPAGLIAASMQAQSARRQFPDEKNLRATLRRLGNELALNNNGSPTHNDDPYTPDMLIQEPRLEKKEKESQLPVRTSRGSANGLPPSYPRNSSLGERSVCTEICSTKGVDLDAESSDENDYLDTDEFDDQAHGSTTRTESNDEVVAAERERHIKGTHLPLRTTKGNALGLRASQARNTGFGEGSGYPSVDKYGDRYV